VALGQIYRGQSVTGTDLYVTECHCDTFIEDKVALGQIYSGKSGTGTDL